MGNPALNFLVGLVRIASWIACLIILVAFILFATNQANAATSQQIAALGQPGNISAAPANKPSSSSTTLRQKVMNVSDTLTSPFHNVFGTTSAWGLHISQLVIALLLYGFGVSFVLRALAMRRA